jgi:hypothetical protein
MVMVLAPTKRPPARTAAKPDRAPEAPSEPTAEIEENQT